MAGSNFALLENWQRGISKTSNTPCVFISHKKEDEEAAIQIGKYLTDIADINIYLDINDFELKEAVSLENDEKIVDSIKKGLECSTHLLCLISDKTRLSWWVPYEIGFAENEDIDITSLKLKNVDDIPSYLKIKRSIFKKEDFYKYICEIKPLAKYFYRENYNTLTSADNTIIEKYID